MKKHKDEWWGISDPSEAWGPLVPRTSGDFIQIKEIDELYGGNVYSLESIPQWCDLYARYLNERRPQDLNLYFHKDWVDLYQKYEELATHSMLQSEILILNSRVQDLIAEQAEILNHRAATISQQNTLMKLFNNGYLQQNERVRLELFIKEDCLTVKRVSRFLQYFFGKQSPDGNGGYYRVSPGVLFDRKYNDVD